MDKRNFPHSKQLCPLLELLCCYPLSLHNIKEARKGNRGPYNASGRLVYNKLFRGWQGRRSEKNSGDFKGVISVLYTSKHPQREIWLPRGHIELIWASDWGPLGNRWVICHPERVMGLKEWKKLSMADFKEVTSPLYSSKHLQMEIWLSWVHVELIWASEGVP